MATNGAQPKHHRATKNEKLVIAASSLGTVFEWYDFYLYGLLATTITSQFFSGVNETTGFILALAAFAAGFAVRPFGALVFGRIGDIVGRKNTFLVTMGIMGASTFAVGLLPSYRRHRRRRPAAPGRTATACRVWRSAAQYGGAATYVAEHAPDRQARALHELDPDHGDARPLRVAAGRDRRALRDRRGGVRRAGAGACRSWLRRCCWCISLWIRLKLNETPVFQKMKAAGQGASKAPLTDSVRAAGATAVSSLIALFGGRRRSGRGLVHGSVLRTVLPREDPQGGWRDHQHPASPIALGDRHAVLHLLRLAERQDRPQGRSSWPAALIAAVTYFPLFGALTNAANPVLAGLPRPSTKITVTADPTAAQSNSTSSSDRGRSSPDLLRPWPRTCADQGGRAPTRAAPGATLVRCPTSVARVDQSASSTSVDGLRRQASRADTVKLARPRSRQRWTTPATPPKPTGCNEQANWFIAVLVLALVLVCVTMVYGPIAAFLVELFPTNIRYTSMSLPYHIGNGWFGGMLPLLATALVAWSGDIYYGLWYPIGVAVHDAGDRDTSSCEKPRTRTSTRVGPRTIQERTGGRRKGRRFHFVAHCHP